MKRHMNNLVFFHIRWRSQSVNLGWWRRRTSWACCVTVRSRSSSSTVPTSCSSTPAPTWTKCFSNTRSTMSHTRVEQTRTLSTWVLSNHFPFEPDLAKKNNFAIFKQYSSKSVQSNLDLHCQLMSLWYPVLFTFSWTDCRLICSHTVCVYDASNKKGVNSVASDQWSLIRELHCLQISQ